MISTKVSDPLPVLDHPQQPSQGPTSIAQIGLVASKRKSKKTKDRKKLNSPSTAIIENDKRSNLISPLTSDNDLLPKIYSKPVIVAPAKEDVDNLDAGVFERTDSNMSTLPPPMRSPSLITPSSLHIESGDSFASIFSTSPATSRSSSTPEIESHYYSDDEHDEWSHEPSLPSKDRRWATSPLEINDSVCPPLTPDQLLVTDDVWADFADF